MIDGVFIPNRVTFCELTTGSIESTSMLLIHHQIGHKQKHTTPWCLMLETAQSAHSARFRVEVTCETAQNVESQQVLQETDLNSRLVAITTNNGENDNSTKTTYDVGYENVLRLNHSDSRDRTSSSRLSAFALH